MTKREMFVAIANRVADDAEMVEFLNHQIELLDGRKASKTPSKTQRENEGVKELILRALVQFDEPVTVSELIAHGEGLDKFTNQKISALLKQLVEGGKVEKSTDGKRSLFAIKRGQQKGSAKAGPSLLSQYL